MKYESREEGTEYEREGRREQRRIEQVVSAQSKVNMEMKKVDIKIPGRGTLKFHMPINFSSRHAEQELHKVGTQANVFKATIHLLIELVELFDLLNYP